MKVTIISPKFHGYYQALQHGIEQLGHSTRAFAYDLRSTTTAKAQWKARVEVPARLGRPTMQREMAWTTQVLRAHLGENVGDVLIVVKGDVVDPEWVAQRRRRGEVAVLWLYDDLHRSRHTSEQLAAYDVVASYSHVDVENLSHLGLASHFLPGAFDARLEQQPPPPNLAPDMVFVGARYGRRAHLLEGAQAAGLTVAAYGRDWSRHPVDRVRTLSWRRPTIPASRDVPLAATAGLLRSAVTALNVHHDQFGFTMRTFEIGGVNGLQIVDRTHVAEFYDPGVEVLVFNELEELIDLVQRAKREPKWASHIRSAAHARTLAEHTFRHRGQTLVSLC